MDRGMKTTGITRIFPGNVQAAFADATSDGVRSPAVVAATADVMSLTWRQTLLTRRTKVTLNQRRARVSLCNVTPPQKVMF